MAFKSIVVFVSYLILITLASWHDEANSGMHRYRPAAIQRWRAMESLACKAEKQESLPAFLLS
jgi:hypothetical protein